MDFNDLKRKHPTLFPRRFQFACGQGWIGILADLLDALEAELPAGIAFRIVQIKEKFGALRFYQDIQPKLPAALQWRIYRLIALAEARSLHVCEQCGRPGGLWNREGFYLTACDIHADATGIDHGGRRARPVPQSPQYERFEDEHSWYRYDRDRDDFVPCSPPPGFD